MNENLKAVLICVLAIIVIVILLLFMTQNIDSSVIEIENQNYIDKNSGKT